MSLWTNKSELILMIVVAILLICLLKDYWKEKYVSKEEKANVITEWFNKNPDPKYINYKHDVEDKVLTPNDVAKLLM